MEHTYESQENYDKALGKLIITGFIAGILFLVLLSGVGSAVGTYPAVDPNMVLYYHFNNNSLIGENDTFVVDSSTASNNGTAYNTQYNNTARFSSDGGLEFLGKNISYINISLAPSLDVNQTAFSICSWIYPKKSDSNNRMIYSKYNSASGSIELSYVNQKFAFDTRNSSLETRMFSSGTYPINNWYYVCAIFDGNITQEIYVNTIQRNNTLSAGGNMNTKKDAFIGGRNSFDTNTFFNGTIDEVIIWNKTITQTEIRNNFYNYLPVQNINSCNTYSTDYTYLNLTTSLTTTQHCVNITGDYIYLQGNSNTINITENNLFGTGVYIFPGSIGNYINNVKINSYSDLSNRYAIYNLGSDSIITNNLLNVSNNYYGFKSHGIWNRGASNTIIGNNTIYDYADDDGWGIYSTDSANLNIYNNTIYTYGQTSEGIFILRTNNSFFTNNNLNALYSNGLRIDGDNYQSYNHSIPQNNLINSLPINYTFNLDNLIYNSIDFSTYGQVFIGWSNNITINNSNFTNSGLFLSRITNSSINNNRFNGTEYSIGISWYSQNNIIYNNFINSSSPVSFHINYNSDNNIIKYNNIYNYGTELRDGDTKYPGIYNYFSNNNTFISNYIETFASSYYPSASEPISTTISNSLTIYNNTLNAYGDQTYQIHILKGSNHNVSNNYLNKNLLSNLSIYSNEINNSIFSNNTFFTYQFDNNNDINDTINYLYSLTNSLIYFSNGSTPCSDISTCDNNINITLTPNNYSYVLDNFNVTEGVTRQFSPISVSGSTTSKTFTSTLSQGVNATVIVNVAQCSLIAKYQNAAYNFDSCDKTNNLATFSLRDIPAGASVLTITYLDLNCSSNTSASVTIILLLSALAVASLSLILVFKWRAGELDLKIMIIVFIAIMVGIALFIATAQNLGGVCSA